MLRSLFRSLKGRLFLLLDGLSRTSPAPRSEQELRLLARELRGLALYERRECPACIRARRLIRRWNVPLELRDIRKSQVHHDALLAGAGRICTPCLRVEEHGGVRWISDAEEILGYLQGRFAPETPRRRAA